MLPRWHVFWGAVFALVVWFFSPAISPLYVLLIFLSSFLIDFDHYITGAIKIRTLSLRKILKYHDELIDKGKEEQKKGLRKKGNFHLFHTVEFISLVGFLGIWWIGFFYIFIGMIFHSLLDIMYLANKKILYRREFFLTNWLLRVDRCFSIFDTDSGNILYTASNNIVDSRFFAS
jgi:hypothetical protein